MEEFFSTLPRPPPGSPPFVPPPPAEAPPAGVSGVMPNPSFNPFSSTPPLAAAAGARMAHQQHGFGGAVHGAGGVGGTPFDAQATARAGMPASQPGMGYSQAVGGAPFGAHASDERGPAPGTAGVSGTPFGTQASYGVGGTNPQPGTSYSQPAWGAQWGAQQPGEFGAAQPAFGVGGTPMQTQHVPSAPSSGAGMASPHQGQGGFPTAQGVGAPTQQFGQAGSAGGQPQQPASGGVHPEAQYWYNQWAQFMNSPWGQMYAQGQGGVPPRATPADLAPWGRPDMAAFMKNVKSVRELDGTNWVAFKYEFEMACRSHRVLRFLIAPPPYGTGYESPSAQTPLGEEYYQYAVGVFHALYSRCNDMIKHEIRGLIAEQYCAAMAWCLLERRCTSQTNGAGLRDYELLSSMVMTVGKGAEYIAQAQNLWMRLINSGFAVTDHNFKVHLVRGLPRTREWGEARLNAQFKCDLVSVQDLCSLIVEEDLRVMHARQVSNQFGTGMLASSDNHTSKPLPRKEPVRPPIPPVRPTRPEQKGGNTVRKCDHCGKTGHVRKKCYQLFPTCFKCQQKGHKSVDCPLNKGPVNRKALESKKQSTSAMVGNVAPATARRSPKPENDKGDAKMEYVNQFRTCALKRDECHWLIDTGCSKHMTPHRHVFETFRKVSTPTFVMDGSGHQLPVEGEGLVEVQSVSGHKIQLLSVMYVPELVTSLLSISTALANGCEIRSKQDRLMVWDKHQRKILDCKSRDGLFQVYLKPLKSMSNVAFMGKHSQPELESASLELHKRLAHMGETHMRRLVNENLAIGLPLEKIRSFKCTDCQVSRMAQKAFKKEGRRHEERLSLVHIDICGPFKSSRHGYRYFASVTDDATRYKWVLLLRTRDEILSKF